MAKTIFIDAGHGGSDPGAVNRSRYEKDDNLAFAKAVKTLLVKQGFNVIMSREDDTYVHLANRAEAANSAKADLFISLHRNSFTDAAANGVEIYVYTTAGVIDEAVAGAVLEHLAAVGAQSNRGVKKGNYHVLRESKMPSMLIELGFISNTKDNEMFDKYFDSYALAVVKGICSALGVAYQSNTTAAQDTPLYRVQVGAFSIKSNAEAFLKTVRDMGLPAFMVSSEASKEGS